MERFACTSFYLTFTFFVKHQEPDTSEEDQVVLLMTETFDSRDCRLQINTPANEITQQTTYRNFLLGSSDLLFLPAVDFELIDFDKQTKQ